MPASFGRLSPAVALAVAVLVPIVVVYVALWAASSAARPLADTEGARYVLTLLAVSGGLCLAPLALWPLGMRAYALAGTAALSALAFVNVFHVAEYSELVTIGAIDAVVNTSGREAGEFLTGRAGGLAAAAAAAHRALGVGGSAALRIPRRTAVPRAARAACAAAGVAAAGLVVLAPMRTFPLSTLKNAVDYVGHRAQYQAAQAERARHRFGATTADVGERPPVVVLVLGETLRRRQLGLYGYDRDTTPRLGALDSLVVFPDAVTTSTFTQTAVKMLMSEATPADVARHAGRSWVALAREAGYQTAWISNQDRTEGTETVLISEDAADVVYTSHSFSASGQLDGDVLPEVDRVLAGRDGPLALVVHLMGSHEDYSLRYPAAFARFAGPPTGRSATEQAHVDHYDNSVLYTDWVTAEVVARVAATGAPAVVVVTSDHGENLFDTPDRARGHGGPVPTPAEVEVPLLVWTSAAFRADRPEVAAALARNRTAAVTTGDLFHGFADLLRTDWAGVHPDRSLFNAAYRPRARWVLAPRGGTLPVESLYGERHAGRHAGRHAK